jgi:leucyl-tRNA synthetase
MAVNFNAIDKKWQSKWERAKIFRVKEDKKKKKYYVLEMFPYPSAYGLHMGHVRNYAVGDCLARFRRMQGFNLLYPMGYDAFGLPAENAAIKHKIHPKKFTEKAIASIIKNQKALGLSYDWTRMIATCYPEYYKWNQWFFLKFLEKDLAYRKMAPVNWCPKCGTVLANEQVEDGKCWRCSSEVEIKQLEQWFLRITQYADELLEDLKKLSGWPEKIRIMQENWIGKSEGTMVNFRLKDSNEIIPIFTTRPDTLFGVTFMVFAPEHPKVMELVKGTEYEQKVKDFVKKVVIQEKFTRAAEDKEKEGMFIGKYAVNPVNGEKIPIYIANFVLLEYGTGFIMAVPAHDQRDFEFAKKYGIQIKVVIKPMNAELRAEQMEAAYIEDGVLTNSGEFDGMGNKVAIHAITEWLEKKNLGKKTVEYKLRDWLISRQRYWGTPIPVVYCEKCGIVPVREKDLPVRLPTDVKFTGRGNPLATSKKFMSVKCPKCKGKARRETDTMDTFVDSSWYFLRYCSPNLETKPFDDKKVSYWLPVDQYIGGAEHAVMHLLYARFFTKVLRDLGLVNFGEPFTKLFNQGVLTKDGTKMSKSVGNIVTQEEISKKYGIDTARLFLLFVASPDKEMEWSDKGVVGCCRFVNKVYNLIANSKIKFKKDKELSAKDKFVLAKTHETIASVTKNIENFELNTAVTSIMSLVNIVEDYAASGANKKVFEEAVEKLIIILSPFAPHLSEEIWSKLGNKNFISLEKWPIAEEKQIDKKIIELDNLFRKNVDDIAHVVKLAGKKENAYLYFVTDKELDYFKEYIEILKKKFEFKKLVACKTTDAKIYDPQGKTQKAKFGKPGIYLE